MKTRVARLYAAHDLKIETDEAAAPGPGEILLRMAAGGICGSDLHYFHDGGFGPVRVREPIISGHEASGRVETLGPGVDGPDAARRGAPAARRAGLAAPILGSAAASTAWRSRIV